MIDLRRRLALPVLLALAVLWILTTGASAANGEGALPVNEEVQASIWEPLGENTDSVVIATDQNWDDSHAPSSWASGEYLLWWTNGVRLPPLITASSDGTPLSEAAILGGPSTEVLFGDESVNNDARSGFRLRGGQWLDDCCTCAFEGSFFLLGTDDEGLTAGSADGSQIVGRPFFNVQTGEGGAELVSFPGVVSGFVTAEANSSEFLGADFGWRNAIYCTPRGRLDWTAGYRFFYYADEVRISERLMPEGPVVPGTEIDVLDSFDARNQFHGGYLGLVAAREHGPWRFEALARLDIGAVVREVEIDGQTTVSVPGAGSATSPGGFLALSSNSGEHHSADAVVVPEFEIRTKYRLTHNWQFVMGYSLIYWSEVARAGEQIDLAVNPDLLPPPVTPVTGPIRPRFALDRSDLVIQGLSFGLEGSF